MTSSPSALTTGEIVGIALGVVGAVVLVACLFYVWGRVRSLSQLLKLQHQSPLPPSPPVATEKLRQGDSSITGFSGGHNSVIDTDRNQTQSPPWIEDDGREFSPSTPNFRYSAHSRAGSGNGSPTMDQRAMSPNGLYADGGLGPESIPEVLKYDITDS